MDDTERAELIAALHQAATFAEGLLNLNEQLLVALATGENRPDLEELEYLRTGLLRWREQTRRSGRGSRGRRSSPLDAVMPNECALFRAQAGRRLVACIG